LDPAAPKKLMPRLNQLFNRARPSEQEIHILRGIARAMRGRTSGDTAPDADKKTNPASDRAPR